jgi:hypothetical protein
LQRQARWEEKAPASEGGGYKSSEGVVAGIGKLGRRLLESKNLPKEGLDMILVR